MTEVRKKEVKAGFPGRVLAVVFWWPGKLGRREREPARRRGKPSPLRSLRRRSEGAKLKMSGETIMVATWEVSFRQEREEREDDGCKKSFKDGRTSTSGSDESERRVSGEAAAERLRQEACGSATKAFLFFGASAEAHVAVWKQSWLS